MAGQLFGVIENAVSGLARNRAGSRLVSQNLANANVEGYHRRSADVDTLPANRAGAVRFDGVERAKAAALTAEARQESGDSARLTSRSEMLRPVGETIGNPDDPDSLSGRMAAFESSLQNLSDAPSDNTRLRETLSAARDVTDEFKALSDKIQNARQRADSRIGDEVKAVNSALERIHDLNGKIAEANQTDEPAATLKDERSRLIDRVSESMGVRVEAGQNGRVDLYTDQGITLLDETSGPADLEFTSAANVTAKDVYTPEGYRNATGPNPWAGYDENALSGLTIDGKDVTPVPSPENEPTGPNLDANAGTQKIETGRLAGLFQARDTDLVSMQSNLDKLAEDMVQTFQSTATDPSTDQDGDGNVEAQGLFMDARVGPDTPYPASYATQPATTPDAGDKVGLAANIKVHENVDPVKANGDVTEIRDGVHANGNTNPNVPADRAQGDNDQVVRFLDAFNASDATTTVSGAESDFVGAAESVVTDVQGRRSAVQTEAETAEEAAKVASDARENAIGISQDQQTQRLLQLEKAYQANTQVIQTANRMFDSLLSATR